MWQSRNHENTNTEHEKKNQRHRRKAARKVMRFSKSLLLLCLAVFFATATFVVALTTSAVSIRNVSVGRKGRVDQLTRRHLFSSLLSRFRNDPPTGVPIIDAVVGKQKASIDAILARNKDAVNDRDPVTLNTAMHIIAKRGHYEFPPADLPAFLIDAGIDINATNNENKTALVIALLSGWQKIAMLLLDRGADRSCVTNEVKQRITCPGTRPSSPRSFSSLCFSHTHARLRFLFLSPHR